MGYKVILKREDCIGCGLCASTAPDFFEMNNKDGLSELKKEKASDDDLASVKEAAEVCPAKVIKILDKNGKEIR